MKIIDHQNTKIVATLGPASKSFAMLCKLAEEGVDVFRLNFSHGNHEEHKKTISNINKVNKKYGLRIAILADLQGPKLRVGLMHNDGVPIQKGDIIEFTTKLCVGTKEKVYIAYKDFARDVKKGEKILIDDGTLILQVVSTNKKDSVKLKVVFGGILKSNKGVNLPDTAISLPSITKKDKKDLKFILKHKEINWVALSFVRSAQDMVQLKRYIRKADHQALCIAKIEKPEALENIDDIISESHGIMIARGDLGVEVPIQKLPSIQKMIIKKCIQAGRPVVVATQLMDSMITNPSPTRAEVTDVANAVLDGTDAVMLSGETSVGAHPHLVVRAMNKIIEETEKHYEIQGKRPIADPNSSTFLSDVVCLNAAKTAEEIKANAIICLTQSGYTGFKISSYRPNVKIYIFSENINRLAAVNIVWGVKGIYYKKFTTTDQTIEDVIKILRDKNLLKQGDIAVNTGSMPIKKRFRTNMLKITIVE